MKNFKRKLAGLLVFAMVLGIMAPGVVAQAADTLPTVTFDLEKEQIEVENVGDYTVEYAEDTKTTGLTTSGSSITEPNAIKEWDEATLKKGGKAIIDLSWATKKKDNTLVVRVTNDNKTYNYYSLPVKAQATKLKAALAPTSDAAVDGAVAVGSNETGWIYFTNDGKGVSSPSAIEWKKGVNGTWEDINPETFAEVLTGFKAKGATLYFRIKADNEAKTWESKEVKFAYKKQAKAPTVKLDVTKQTLSLKKGQEYAVKIGDGAYSEWFKIDDNHMKGTKVNTIRLEDLIVSKPSSDKAVNVSVDNIYDDGITVKIRTAATTKAIPSKIKTIAITPVSGGAAEFTVTAEAATANAITVAYTVPDLPSKGVTITSHLEGEYEFAYVTTLSAIDAKTKWTKFNKGKIGKLAVKEGDTTGKKLDPSKPGILCVRLQGVTEGKDKDTRKVIPAQLSGKISYLDMSNVQTKVPALAPSTAVSGVSGATISLATGAAANVVTVPVVSGSAVESDAKLTVALDFDNAADVEGKVTVDGTKVSTITAPTNVKIDKNGKANFEVTVKKGTAKDATVTYKIKVYNTEIKLQIKVTSK